MSLFKWSRTADLNSTIDATINAREGQAPSTVNNAMRAIMAAIAKFRDDVAANTTTDGTSTAYTLATYQTFTALTTGLLVGFTAHTTNGTPATLNVDSLGAKPLRTATGVAIAAGILKAGAPYQAVYNLAADEWRVLGSMIGAGPTAQIFTASGTWTKPTGLVKVKVTVVGAGGGGGGAAADAQGGGGGGGGTAIKWIAAATLGATETVTVGAGGAAGAAGANNGTVGGASSFGTHATGNGGDGGSGTGGAGTGGTAAGGSINISGNSSSQIGAVVTGGTGGGSHLGGAGRGGASSAGAAGTSGGGGGGASGNGAVARAGGVGGAGVVIVEEFYS